MSNCYRRFTFGTVYSAAQQVVFTVLADPPGCRRLYTSPVTITWHGGDTITSINAFYRCGEALLLEDLRTASLSAGAGKSLADKVALAWSQYQFGDIAALRDSLRNTNLIGATCNSPLEETLRWSGAMRAEEGLRRLPHERSR